MGKKTDVTLEEAQTLVEQVREILKNATALQTQLATSERSVALNAANVEKHNASVQSVGQTLQEYKTALVKQKTGLEEVQENLETELEELKTKWDELKTKLEGDITALSKEASLMLNSASNAALAKAYAERKSECEKKGDLWRRVFFWAVGGIATLTFGDILIRYAFSVGSGQIDLWKGFLERLPFIAPLIWLGTYAQFRISLYSRLSEDYAFKEATSIAFEGYKRQLMDDGEMLSAFYKNVLGILRNEPDRIYGSVKEPKAPIDLVSDAVGTATDKIRP